MPVNHTESIQFAGPHNYQKYSGTENTKIYIGFKIILLTSVNKLTVLKNS